MGDVHFILRHALTGAVLLLFVWLGWWISSPDQAELFLESVSLERAEKLLGALVTIPIAGIVIQGAHVLGLHVFGSLFSDKARLLASERVKQAAQSSAFVRLGPEHCHEITPLLTSAPADSMFVWMYYSSANQNMIDWARRRRSYYYLGANFSSASLLGLLVGLLMPAVQALGRDILVYAIVMLALLWAGCSALLAGVMKRDVDAMELLWVLDHLDPEFHRSIRAKQDISPARKLPNGGVAK